MKKFSPEQIQRWEARKNKAARIKATVAYLHRAWSKPKITQMPPTRHEIDIIQVLNALEARR